ncbi:MAG: CoA transferase [Halieaceae bacterium]|jgi:crotonobetainyl-CoA:carnitine CoA-transferase CaiB-like acyl-CoA transferase|nr:CoA transferase [Halieaceae bacterium]
MENSSNRPLEGVRIIDLSSDIAGPYSSKLFVDAGATVIKVEPPGGDKLRAWRASGKPVPEGEDGALFQFLNASKASIVLDLEQQVDRETLKKMAGTADLIIEDFGPGGLQTFGLSYDELKRDNPALSLISISPWGLTGPWANRPCTEFTQQCATGSTSFRGLPDGMPVAAGGRLGEWICGSFAAIAAISAWLSARSTGRGQHVDVSAFESMILCLVLYHDLNGYWHGGLQPRSIEIPSIEKAKDGWIGFCTITGQQWVDFCSLIGQPEVGSDEKYLMIGERYQHSEFLKGIIEQWTSKHTVEEIVQLASLMRIPVAPVGNGKNLLDVDHMQERDVFWKNAAGFSQPRPPYRLGQATALPPGAAPALDQHRESIMAELEQLTATRKPGESPEAVGELLPLKGLRVVDLTAFLAGPFATSVLADLGADVIKVESVQRPDGMRFAGAVQNERLWEWSPVFAGANRGKRGITLRLDNEEGIALLKNLIETADVVIENFSVRVLAQFGLTWDSIHALNPKTILLRMPAFGLDGPWRDHTGFAMTVEQASGLAWVTGYKDMPVVVRGACDPVGGVHAVFALLLALENRRSSGEGQLVEVPLIETALNIAAEQVIEYSAYGELLGTNENRSSYAAPQGIYRCRGEEQFLALAITNDEQWRVLCSLIPQNALLVDDKLATAAGRHQWHDEIDEQLNQWMATQDINALETKLLDLGIAAQVLINSHNLMPNEQLIHREFFYTLEHIYTGKARYPGLPFNYSLLGSQLPTTPPPVLGQNNDQILGGELHLSEQEIRELRDKAIIGERPIFM